MDSIRQILSSSTSVQSGTSTIFINHDGNKIDKNRLYNGKANVTPNLQKEINSLLATEATERKTSGESSPKQLQCLSKQVLVSVAVSIGSMVIGFSLGYTSPALASMAQPGSTLNISRQQESWIGSLMPLSALVGGMIGGRMADSMGRKLTLVVTSIPFIVSWLLIALASNVPMLYIGRAISGLCVGIASLCLPVYMGETVQAEVRGMLGLIPTLLGNMGILIVFVAGKYLNWSHLAYFGCGISILFFLCTCLIPETPRWYISKNKTEKARESLYRLRGGCTDIIDKELQEIKEYHEDAQTNSPSSCMEIFTRHNMKLITISIGLMFFQQLSGINAVIFYTVQIFQDAGSSIDVNLSTIIVGVVNLCSTVIATALIDRLGRKILLYISATAMFVSLTFLGTFFYLRDHGSSYIDVGQWGWLPLVCFIVYVIGFSLGYGPIPWLMMGEILPAKIRGRAAALVTAFNWASTFIVTKTFNDLISALRTHGAFFSFASVCFISLFFVVFCVPETRGKSLENIEKELKSKSSQGKSLEKIEKLGSSKLSESVIVQ